MALKATLLALGMVSLMPFQMDLGGAVHLRRPQKFSDSLRHEQRDEQAQNLRSLCGNDPSHHGVIFNKCLVKSSPDYKIISKCDYHLWGR
jgi:hypothetical protein